MRALVVVIFMSVGCASRPTPYVEHKEDAKTKDGYSDKVIDNNLKVSTFQGNASTKKETAELYAKFHAIEICHQLGKTYTHILRVKDNSFTKNITQTTAVGPSYYYGMSPYYGGYAYGPGLGMSYGATSTTTRNETYNYPLFDVYFECVDKPMDPRISFNPLSVSQMKDLVKDVMGAVQVNEVLKDSPNLGKIQSGDIVIKGGGVRVETVQALYQAFKNSNPNNFKLEFFRDGIKKEVTVKSLDVTELVAYAQEQIIKDACQKEGIKDVSKLCIKM
jgi:hypothetical protein